MCTSITWPLTQSLQIAAAMVIIKKKYHHFSQEYLLRSS